MITCDRSAALHYGDGEGHRYPSISQVLEKMYGDRFQYVAPDVLAESRAKGNRRHYLFAVLLLFTAGLAKHPEIDPRDELVAHGLLGWIYRNDVYPLRVEEPGINRKDGYAGRPDAKVLYGARRRKLIPDLKTGAVAEAYRVQVQAQWRLDGYEDAQDLMDLYVDDEGNIKERFVTPDPRDWARFLNAVKTLHAEQGGYHYEIQSH